MLPCRIHRIYVLIGLACLLPLGGCAEGWKASALETRDWLPGALPDLRQIIIMLRTCQPHRRSGYNVLWANDSDGGDEQIHCARGGTDEPLDDIRLRLRRNDILGVGHSPSPNANTAVDYANFILFREGLVTGGSSTGLEYHRVSRPCVATSEGGPKDGYHVVHEPIGQTSCHWFWEQDDN
jgi:hypothetical protein